MVLSEFTEDLTNQIMDEINKTIRELTKDTKKKLAELNEMIKKCKWSVYKIIRVYEKVLNKSGRLKVMLKVWTAEEPIMRIEYKN